MSKRPLRYRGVDLTGRPHRDARNDLTAATWPRRAAAALIDSVVILLVGAVVLAIVGYRPYWHQLHARALSGGERAVRDGIPIVLSWLYMATAVWRLNGRTVGKQLLGIRVCRRDGNEVSYLQAIFRETVLKLAIFDLLTLAVGLGGVALLVSLIDDLAPLWPANRENLAIHDLIAGTRVVFQEGR
jgi:uncharacterized RDD family membrane protein YckC